MKNKLLYLLILALLALTGAFFSSFVLGQDAIEIMPPTRHDFELFLASINGSKGMVSLGGAAAITQLLLYLFKTDLGVLLGRWRLVAVTGLTVIAGMTTLKISGLDWPSSLMHGTTLAAFQVFLHQFYKQFAEKKD